MNAPVPPHKPRVVQPQAVTPVPATAMRQPRVVTGATAAAAAAIPPAPPSPAMPRRVPGVARVHLAVSVADLGLMFPEQSPAVLQAAVRVLATVSPKDFGWRQVQAIGAPAQALFGRASDQLLAVSRNEAQRAALQHVGRLVELLNGMLPAYGGGTGLWSRKPRQQDLDRTLREVDQLRKTLRDLLPTLDALFSELDRSETDLDQARQDLAGAAVACQYLTRADPPMPRDALDVLPDRGLELSRASAAALHTLPLLNAQQQGLATLRQQIRESVLTAVPAWLATWSTAPAEPNETERFSLHQALTRLLETLKN